MDTKQERRLPAGVRIRDVAERSGSDLRSVAKFLDGSPLRALATKRIQKALEELSAERAESGWENAT